MDLLKGPIREGSRGGRADFKWSDVASDKDRENYLGHSLMAPVGRWQKNKDLTWYSKDKSASADEARLARQEELRRIKEAEAEALSEALGFPVTRRRLEPGVTDGEVERAINETEEVEEGGMGKGVGFGRNVFAAAAAGPGTGTNTEVLGGRDDAFVPVKKEKERKRSRSRERHHKSSRRDGSRDREKRRHRRSRSRERDSGKSRETERVRPRERSRERDREKRRDGSRERKPRVDRDRERSDDSHRRNRRSRSRSPRERRR